MERNEKGEDQVKAVCFAAGTAALMACIEPILFTSKSQTPSDDIVREDGANSEIKKKKSIRQECARPLVSTNGGGEMLKSDETGEAVVCKKEISVEDDGKKEDNEQLSKEELNQRVEAFIAMFRQHLVSDAKSCGLNYHDKRNSSKSNISAFGVNFGMFETNI
ncbi:UNVERIFIED_CONTAM: hypothetical protein Slati_1617400 [Sesamum latifolium]|uniref:Uncharacterized protein n=1 Tax=Sesamum latifolium TaxID=2727402 RepID=A0AAW2X904_9LAMI